MTKKKKLGTCWEPEEVEVLSGLLCDRSLPFLLQLPSFVKIFLELEYPKNSGGKNPNTGCFSLLCSLCCQWRHILSISPHGSLEVNRQHNTEVIHFPQNFTHIGGDRCAVDRFGGCNNWGPQVHSPDVPQSNNATRSPLKHLKLMLKRIKLNSINKGSRRKTKTKGKERRKRKGSQQENFWVTLLIKLSVKFKNPTAFYLWAWKDERSKEQKVVTFMFIHKYLERTCLCLTPSFST